MNAFQAFHLISPLPAAAIVVLPIPFLSFTHSAEIGE
jgi:hypothetical protein